MEFTKLNETIISLFEMADEYHYNYTWLIADKFSNTRCAAMEIIESCLCHITGDRREFHTWISIELEKFFMEFFSTDNERVIRLTNRRINKDCRHRIFKQDLAYHIFMKLSKLDWSNFSYGSGRNVVLKIITDFIHNLYYIENK